MKDPDLNKLKITPICQTCKKEIKLPKLYQIYCCDKCEEHSKEQLNLFNEKKWVCICSTCGLKFRKAERNSSTRVCEACRRLERKEYAKEWARKQPKKEPKPKKCVPYKELIRRSEQKRLFSDSGWSHYLKGRKWDRI